ncbi:hypothetical protein [Caulobacter sp.]|uniref:hypothetical protein n=1 Tax=Caulobacter sp. TaxID=78 RepID=UPI003BAC700B
MKLAKWFLMVGALATTPVLALAAPAPKAADSDSPGVHLSRMTLGYSYFNQPGASIQDHNADVLACLSQAVTTRSFDQVINNGADMGLAGMFIGGALGKAYYHGTVGAGLENCMVVRGWRVVRLSDAQGQALAALPQAALMDRLAPWVGANAPPGTLVRAWNNDAANAAIPRFSIRPAHQNDGSLSLKAANGQTLDEASGPNFMPPERIKLDKAWPRKPVKPAGIAAVTPQAGIVLIRVSNGGMKNGAGVSFTRVGSSPETPASSVDHRPDLVSFGANGDFIAMPVAPGRWRMSSLGFAPVLSLCLGSPAFEIKAGEVVYLGSFDLGATAMGPDLDPAPVRAFLAGQPAAGAVRPAAYVNGSTSACTDPGMYAFEVPGAPFEEGYRFGGARLAAASPPPPPTVAAFSAPAPPAWAARQTPRPPASPPPRFASEPEPRPSQPMARSPAASSQGLLGFAPPAGPTPAGNQVDGQGLLTREGQTRTCAGGHAWIIPATAEADAFLQQAFGPLRSGLILTTRWEGLPFDGAPRVTTCDAHGRFQFSGLPNGAYHLAVVVSWELPSQQGAYLEQRGGTIVAPVTLSGGGVRSVTIAN